MSLLNKTNVSLRAIEPEDLDIIYLWENDTDIWEVSNTLTPFSRYIIKLYLENAHLDIFAAKQLRLMIEYHHPNEPALPVGTVDLFDFDPHHQRAGVGILIAQKENRFKGYGKAALQLIINYAFKHLSMHQLYCNIAETNKESLQLFKNEGFIICGKKEQWVKKEDLFEAEYMLQLLNPAKNNS